LAENELRYRWLESEVNVAGKDVIDFGCWTGVTLREVASRGAARIVGVDLPGPWMDAARSHTPRVELYDTVSFGSLPPELTGAFDVAFLLETMEHVPRRTEDEAARAIFSTLRPGGTLVVSTPAAGVAATLDPAWWLVGHRHYRRRTLQSVLLRAGFSECDMRFSGNLARSTDVLAMYVSKHILRRGYRSSPRLERLQDTGLRARRSVSSATIWAIAVKPLSGSNR
jgi:SAM-dependent methyltransferase